MEKVSGIYRIVCKANGNYYYGSAKNMKSRWAIHKSHLRNGKHFNPMVQHTWNKYGENTFQCELTELVPLDKLIEVEDGYLKEHVGRPHCMNISNNATSPSHTPSIRKKISESVQKYYSNPENRKKTGIARAKYCQSHPMSAEKRQHASKTTKLYFSNDANRKRVSEQTKTQLSNPDIKKKMDDARNKYWSNPENRKKASERTKAYNQKNPDARKKHSEFMKAYYSNPELRKKNKE